LVQASASLANWSIKRIIDLKDYFRALQTETQKIDRLLGKGGDVDELLSQRMEMLSKKEQVGVQIEKLRQELGVSEKANLKICSITSIFRLACRQRH
jgi:hypothetical protein